jgi:hypothetical protein
MKLAEDHAGSNSGIVSAPSALACHDSTDNRSVTVDSRSENIQSTVESIQTKDCQAPPCLEPLEVARNSFAQLVASSQKINRTQTPDFASSARSALKSEHESNLSKGTTQPPDPDQFKVNQSIVDQQKDPFTNARAEKPSIKPETDKVHRITPISFDANQFDVIKRAQPHLSSAISNSKPIKSKSTKPVETAPTSSSFTSFAKQTITTTASSANSSFPNEVSIASPRPPSSSSSIVNPFFTPSLQSLAPGLHPPFIDNLFAANSKSRIASSESRFDRVFCVLTLLNLFLYVQIKTH